LASNTACAVDDGAALILTGKEVGHAGLGAGDGHEGEEDCRDGELHFELWFVDW